MCGNGCCMWQSGQAKHHLSHMASSPGQFGTLTACDTHPDWTALPAVPIPTTPGSAPHVLTSMEYTLHAVPTPTAPGPMLQCSSQTSWSRCCVECMSWDSGNRCHVLWIQHEGVREVCGPDPVHVLALCHASGPQGLMNLSPWV